MCKRNCAYRAGLHGREELTREACCNYSRVMEGTYKEYKTRMGALCHRMNLPPTDPVLLETLKGEHCPFYIWDGKGERTKSTPVDVEEIRRRQREAEEQKKQIRVARSLQHIVIPEELAIRIAACYASGLTDQEIAQQLKIGKTTVQKWRLENGKDGAVLAAIREKDRETHEKRLKLWQAGMTDKAIAMNMQEKVSAVTNWRNRHGLACNRKCRTPATMEQIERVIELNAAGKVDRIVAAEVGLSEAQITNLRKKLNLPANKKRMKFSRESFRMLYEQGMTDREICLEMNCSPATVINWRNVERLSPNPPKKEAKRK